MAANFARLPTPTIISLGKAGAVAQLTRACRAAMLDFVNGAPFWDKRALATWLVGRYAPLVKNVAQPPMPRRAVLVLEPRLVEILGDARHTLLACLRLARRNHAASAGAWRMIRLGALSPCEDDEARGWMPVSLPRMRLRDRLLSLWAVDYFADDSEYESSLAICARCQRVEFDALSVARSTCRAHSSAFSERPPRESITRMRTRGDR